MRAYGISNAAFYNLRYEGDVTFFASRKDREAALEELREEAELAGLATSAAKAGIFRVSLVRRDLPRGYTVVEWLAEYRSYDDRPSIQAEMLDRVNL